MLQLAVFDILAQASAFASDDPTTGAALESLRSANEQMPALIAGEIIAKLKIDCALLATFLLVITIVRVVIEVRRENRARRSGR